MRTFCFLAFVIASFVVNAQSIRNFQKKNSSNQLERTQMLDLLRVSVKNDIEQDVVFVVDHFLVSSTYAWMEGSVQRKDGKELKMPADHYDCCHVEALFKKVKGKWILKENGAFSSDVWYSCLLEQYPDVELSIFSSDKRQIVNCK
jgi:LAS superfamily LD-carboxypeptidase LdcB